MSHSKLTPAKTTNRDRLIKLKENHEIETLFRKVDHTTGGASEKVKQSIEWLKRLERSPYPTRSENAEIALQSIALLEQQIHEQRKEFTSRIARAVSRLRMLNEEFARHRWCEPFAKEFFEETILILLRKERRDARD